MRATSLARYRYTGPTSGVTLADGAPHGAAGGREVMFFAGAVVELPSDHPYVVGLVTRGHLVALPAAAPSAPAPSAERPKPTKETR